MSELSCAGWRRTLLGIGLSALVSAAAAHPHSWVDYTQRLDFDPQGRAVALTQQWKLDPIYSLSLFESLGIKPHRAPTAAQQQRLSNEVAHNLQEAHYLSYVKQGGRTVPFADAHDYRADIDDQRLVFTFTLPFKSPLTLTRPLEIQVYDSSYFVEFLYANDTAHPLELAAAPANCQAVIRHANPSAAQVARAAAIDVTGQAADGMGKQFTDTGIITCRAP